MNVLAVGAHPDDVEIGCGGMLAAHRDRGDSITVVVLSTGERDPRMGEIRRAEQEVSADMLGAHLEWVGYPLGALTTSSEAVQRVEEALTRSSADVVYTHCPRDGHTEHAAASAVAAGACRRAATLLYFQSPWSAGFNPTVFADITPYFEDKMALLKCHASQLECGRIDPDDLRALAAYWAVRMRGSFAEGFEPHRMELDLRAWT